MKVGIIGERLNAMSYAMLSKSVSCDNVTVAWFADSTIPPAKGSELYGKSFDEGLLASGLTRLRELVRRRPAAAPDPDCMRFCEENGVAYLAPRNGSINAGLPAHMYAQAEVDYVLVGGCDQLLDENGLKLARKAVVNYHYSPLPAYRGKFAAFWQWYNREPFIGYSYHYVNLGIDTGEVLYQGKVLYDPEERFSTVVSRVAAESTDKVCEVYACLSARTKRLLSETFESSYYPSRKRVELITAGAHRTVEEVLTVFRRLGYFRLSNGLMVTRVLASGPAVTSAYELDRDGILIPLRDGYVKGRLACTLPYRLFRSLCGRRALRELNGS